MRKEARRRNVTASGEAAVTEEYVCVALTYCPTS